MKMLAAVALSCLALLTLPTNRAAAQRPGQSPPPQPAPTTTAPLETPPPPVIRGTLASQVVYRVPGMEKVAVKSDLKYTATDNPHLLLDVYTPSGLSKGERRPAVLFIHGGARADARPKDWGVYTSWGRLVAASGMVGVTFTHRLGHPTPLLAEAASDVEAAIAYVRANADSLGVDRDRICLAAYSSGGPLLSAAVRDRPPYVRCLVAFYAFLDIRQSEPHKALVTPENLSGFSPVTHLGNDAGRVAPIFIARAGVERVPMLNDSIDRFVREAVAANAAVTLVNHPRGVHGFDTQTDDERSREIVRSALDFMRTHLGLGASR